MLAFTSIGQQGLLCTASGAKAVARLGKVRLKDRLEYLQYRLLDQSIHRRRDAQESRSA